MKKVQKNLDALTSSAKSDLKPQVDEVKSSLDDLQTVVSGFGNGSISSNLTKAGQAISKVGTSAAITRRVTEHELPVAQALSSASRASGCRRRLGHVGGGGFMRAIRLTTNATTVTRYSCPKSASTTAIARPRPAAAVRSPYPTVVSVTKLK